MEPLLPTFEDDFSAGKNSHLPTELLIVPIKDIVIFPSMVVTIFVHNEKLVKAVLDASHRQEFIGVITQKDRTKPVPPASNLYEAGTTVNILQITKGGSSNEAMILVEGISRFTVREFIQEDPYIQAHVEIIPAFLREDSLEIAAGMAELKELIRAISNEGKKLPEELFVSLENMESIDEVLDLASAYLTLSVKKKQDLVGIVKVEERLNKVLNYLNRELELLRIRKKIHTNISKEINKNERNFLLRQELKAIKKELGEKDEGGFGLGEGLTTDGNEIKELQGKIKAAQMPPEVEKIAMQELERLQKIIPISPEFNVSRTYIEWLYSMPWNKSCPTKIDVKVARKILDEDHYGLEKIKERILEYLAVCQLKENCGATILCFVGPPGVGKTSLGRSIARAMDRSFIHTSLGGIRDEADIRGHRRTYVGALPGRIIQSIKRAGCNDAVFMLDEIDKIGRDFQGDPASALLEALDPEQNFAFTDHYLDVPFNLSKVFFITTANILDPIPPALLDRMEIIELAGYTEEEKLQISKKYLLPKQLTANGLEKMPFEMTDEAILKIVRYYTNEAGLRELERQIGTICRKVAKDLVEKKIKTAKVSVKDLEKYLGVEKYFLEAAQAQDMVGVATGLAWTPTGGDIIFIEATKMKGSKNLILTGSLGEVMQESARAALSYIRSNNKLFKIPDRAFEQSDIHIHVPEGATPKDGPSAGITMCTALISLLSNRKVRHDVAMTGEVTLTGRILPIGGLKEKLLAAKRARIKTILIPERNVKDLIEIPKHLLKNIIIKPVKTLSDVVKIALEP